MPMPPLSAVAAKATVSGVRVTTTGTGALAEATALVRSARTSATGEIFSLRDQPLEAAFADQLRLKHTVQLLQDPETAVTDPGAVQRLVDAGARRVKYGTSIAGKAHAKSVSADRNRAFVTTATFIERTHQRHEIGMRFYGAAARAVAFLTESAMTRDTATIRRAAREAARHGVYLNDATHGVDLLSQRIFGMIEGANDELIVATKRLEDKRVVKAIIAAHERGAKVRVDVGAMTSRAQERLDAAGVPCTHLPWMMASKAHYNAIIADGVAYVGSAHLSPRALVRGDTERASRELGVVLGGRVAVGKVRALLN